MNWHGEGRQFLYIWTNGLVAVLCFYMLSGFLIAMVLNEKYKGPGAIWEFYGARIGRIFPVYLIVLFSTVFLMWALNEPNPFHGKDMTLLRWVFVVGSNLGIFGLDLYRFLPDFVTEDMRVIPIAFTLSIELQFYLAAPFIVSRKLIFVVLALAALLALRFATPDLENYETWRYYFAPSVWCFFLVGVVSYRLSVLISDKIKPALAIVGIIAVAVAAHVGDPHTLKNLDSPELWVFYVAFAFAIPYVFFLTKRDRLDGLLGDLSYPIYLIHLTVGPTLAYMAFAGLWTWPKELTSFRVIVYVTMMCSILLLIIERPIRGGIKRYIDSRRRTALSHVGKLDRDQDDVVDLAHPDLEADVAALGHSLVTVDQHSGR